MSGLWSVGTLWGVGEGFPIGGSMRYKYDLAVDWGVCVCVEGLWLVGAAIAYSRLQAQEDTLQLLS